MAEKVCGNVPVKKSDKQRGRGREGEREGAREIDGK